MWGQRDTCILLDMETAVHKAKQTQFGAHSPKVLQRVPLEPLNDFDTARSSQGQGQPMCHMWHAYQRNGWQWNKTDNMSFKDISRSMSTSTMPIWEKWP